MEEKQRTVLLMAATIFSNQHKPAAEHGKPHLGYRRAIMEARALYDEHEKLLAEESAKKGEAA